MTANPNRKSRRFDLSSSPKYVGEAPPNTATSEAKWFIKRLSFTGSDLTKIETSGNAAVWDDRATTTYE